jgi:hypothetical protein
MLRLKKFRPRIVRGPHLGWCTHGGVFAGEKIEESMTFGPSFGGCFGAATPLHIPRRLIS